MPLLASRWTRRDLLRTSAATLAASALPAWLVERTVDEARGAQPPGPNERPRIALIGCGNRGTRVTQDATRFADVVAVCDVDRAHLERARKLFPGAKAYKDFRDLCEARNIDAIVNGTPDHWHTLVNCGLCTAAGMSTAKSR